MDWNQEQESELLKLRKAGLTAEQIAERLAGRTLSAVRAKITHLRKRGLIKTKSRDVGWADEEIESLKKFWSEGLSPSQIAELLPERTRNSVIGKVHRLGLSGRATPSRPKKGRKSTVVKPVNRSVASVPKGSLSPKRSVEKPVAVVPISAKAEMPFGVSSAVLGINDTLCKWPYGDPGEGKDFHFCGRKAPSGPYCDRHANMAYQPSARREMAVAQLAVAKNS